VESSTYYTNKAEGRGNEDYFPVGREAMSSARSLYLKNQYPLHSFFYSRFLAYYSHFEKNKNKLLCRG
jgi:hypothetical protein